MKAADRPEADSGDEDLFSMCMADVDVRARRLYAQALKDGDNYRIQLYRGILGWSHMVWMRDVPGDMLRSLTEPVRCISVQGVEGLLHSKGSWVEIHWVDGRISDLLIEDPDYPDPDLLIEV